MRGASGAGQAEVRRESAVVARRGPLSPAPRPAYLAGMAIEIEKRFVVDAPVERVWAFLTDLERVAGCLKGASITERDEDGAWSGTMKVKLGPVSSAYEGTARFVATDESEHVAELSAEGRDARGKGGVDMTMRSELTATGDGTEVHVASTVHVTGVLARMGRGMIVDVSDQLFARFTECVRGKLEAEGEERASGDDAAEVAGAADVGGAVDAGDAAHAAPSGSAATSPDDESLELGSLGARAAGRAAGRTLRRPLFWVVVALLAAVAWLLGG